MRPCHHHMRLYRKLRHTSGVGASGLIGHPIAHSRSPAMQQAAFDALGFPARYELWDASR